MKPKEKDQGEIAIVAEAKSSNSTAPTIDASTVTVKATDLAKANGTLPANATTPEKLSKKPTKEGPIPRPAILLTGATHARELITVQMNLYTALKLLHQGIINKDEKYQNMLLQNIYYIIPVVNVDGVALIEKEFPKSKGSILKKRKNMSPNAT